MIRSGGEKELKDKKRTDVVIVMCNSSSRQAYIVNVRIPVFMSALLVLLCCCRPTQYSSTRQSKLQIEWLILHWKQNTARLFLCSLENSEQGFTLDIKSLRLVPLMILSSTIAQYNRMRFCSV